LALFGTLLLLARVESATRGQASGTEVLYHWDWSRGAESRWIEREIQLFERDHLGVTVRRVNIEDWQRYREILGATIDGHGEVDVFFMPRRLALSELVKRGWVAPLDALADDEWQKRYPQGELKASQYQGHVYSFPIEAPSAKVRVLLANRRVFERAGLILPGEPTPLIETWEDLVRVARQLTKKEPAQWGIGFGGRMPGGVMDYWLDLAQAGGGFYYHGGLDGFDPRVGRFEYERNPAYAGAIRVLLALRDAGSLAPGTMSLRNDASLRNFAEGRFGLTIATLSDLRQLAELSPRLGDIEVMRLPRPDPSARCSWFYFGAGRTFHMAKGASHSAIGWMKWLSSKEASARWAAAGLGPTLLADDSPQTPAFARFHEIAEKEACQAPNPADRKPEFERLRIRPTTPDAPDVIEGVLVGRLTLDGALRELDVAKARALEEAIEEMNKTGSRFTFEDLVFKDWSAHGRAKAND
jgi:ABC-type glycerol-3-phosphate transport system substrate-binding protein